VATEEVKQAAGPTVREWLDIHEAEVAQRGNLKPQTLRNRRTLIEHCRKLWGDRLLQELRPMHVMSAIREHMLPDHSSSARRVMGELKEAMNAAVLNDWIQANPVQPLKRPTHKILRQRLTFEAWAGMRELAKASRQRWVESLLLLALVTGQRRSDLAKMRFDDVILADDGREYLRVEQQKEGGKGYGARVEIPLDLRCEAIGMTLRDVIAFCRTCGRPGDTLIRQANGRAVEVSSLSARFGEVIQVVLGDADPGPRRRPSLHEVRSLAARTYIASGVKDVQTLLGHSDAEMTELYLNDRGLSARQYKRVQLPDVMVPARRTEAEAQPG
jgi:integrase